MEPGKKNKSVDPKGNKGTGGEMVWIRFKPGRAGAGVQILEDGSAKANADQAAYWVSIGYAEYINEGE